MINKSQIDVHGNVVIQDANNSEININTNNPEEIRRFFIDFQNKLNELSKNFLVLMESKNPNKIIIESGANIYLSLNLMSAGMGINGMSFGETITNLTKGNRFFNAPLFKLSIPFEGD